MADTRMPKIHQEQRIAYLEKLKDFPKEKLDKIKLKYETTWLTSSA